MPSSKVVPKTYVKCRKLKSLSVANAYRWVALGSRSITVQDEQFLF